MARRSPSHGEEARPPEASPAGVESRRQLRRRARDLGVNYIDTGFMYCAAESEQAVGRALRGRRESITLTTKATKQRMENPGDLARMLEHQLVLPRRDF